LWDHPFPFSVSLGKQNGSPQKKKAYGRKEKAVLHDIFTPINRAPVSAGSPEVKLMFTKIANFQGRIKGRF
jgi:hypothetical protein